MKINKLLLLLSLIYTNCQGASKALVLSKIDGDAKVQAAADVDRKVHVVSVQAVPQAAGAGQCQIESKSNAEALRVALLDSLNKMEIDSDQKKAIKDYINNVFLIIPAEIVDKIISELRIVKIELVQNALRYILALEIPEELRTTIEKCIFQALAVVHIPIVEATVRNSIINETNNLHKHLKEIDMPETLRFPIRQFLFRIVMLDRIDSNTTKLRDKFKAKLEQQTKALNNVLSVKQHPILLQPLNDVAKDYLCEGYFYKVFQQLSGHTGTIGSIVQLNDDRLVSSSKDGEVIVWARDLHGRYAIQSTFIIWNSRLSCSIIQLKDGKLAIQSNNNIYIYSMDDKGVCKQEAILIGHTDQVDSIIQLVDGRLATASCDNTIRIWNLDAQGKYECTNILADHKDEVYLVIQLEDGKLASCSRDRTIRIWDLDKPQGEQCIATLKPHARRVYAVLQLKDGRLAASDSMKNIYVWNLSNSKLELVIKNTEVDPCDFNASLKPMFLLKELRDGKLVSISKSAEEIFIWDLNKPEGQRRIAILKGHKKKVTEVIQLSDGRLASASKDGTVRIWNLNKPSGQQCEAIITGHIFPVCCLKQLKDGRLVSGSSDKTVIIWEEDKQDPIGLDLIDKDEVNLHLVEEGQVAETVPERVFNALTDVGKYNPGLGEGVQSSQASNLVQASLYLGQKIYEIMLARSKNPPAGHGLQLMEEKSPVNPGIRVSEAKDFQASNLTTSK